MCVGYESAIICRCFFFNDTATTEIYTLSLHDALPISLRAITARQLQALVRRLGLGKRSSRRSRSKHARIWHRPKPNHLNRCLTVRDVLIDEEVLLTRLSVDCVDLQKSTAADLGRGYVASPRYV